MKPRRMRGHAYAAHPKLGIGSLFPEKELERYPRAGHALVDATAKMYATGEFFSWLRRGRGLSGVRLVPATSARRCSVRSRRCSRGARYRPSTVHFYRNVLRQMLVTRRKAAASMLKAIHAQESREACTRKTEGSAEELEPVRLGTAARTARDGFAETLAYTEFPPEHRR